MNNLSVSADTEHKVNVALNPSDAEDKATSLVGIPTWKVTSGDATLSVADDGLSAFLISGAPGVSTVQIDAEGDPTPGVDHLTGIVTLTVTPAEASDLGLTAAPPVLK